MQRMPQRPQRRLLHGLAERGVRVDGAGHVLQRRAHLQRMREGRGAGIDHATDGHGHGPVQLCRRTAGHSGAATG